MKCCDNPIIKDFSFKRTSFEKVEHKYCDRCHSHIYEGKLWDKHQWDAWINAVEECQSIVEFHSGGKLQEWDDMELLKGGE